MRKKTLFRGKQTSPQNLSHQIAFIFWTSTHTGSDNNVDEKNAVELRENIERNQDARDISDIRADNTRHEIQELHMNDDWKGTLECQNHIHQPPLYAYHSAEEEEREDFPHRFSSFIFCSLLWDVCFKPYSSSSRVNFLRLREFVFFIVRSVAEADIHLQIIRPLSVCFVMFIPYSRQQRPLTTCSSCWHISQKIAIVFRLFSKKKQNSIRGGEAEEEKVGRR